MAPRAGLSLCSRRMALGTGGEDAVTYSCPCGMLTLRAIWRSLAALKSRCRVEGRRERLMSSGWGKGKGGFVKDQIPS
jgi:hypothetical protein